MSLPIYKNKDLGLLILRVGIGASFVIFHGADKMFGGPAKWEAIGGAMGVFDIHFFPAFWGFMCALAEFGGGILLIVGYQTRIAAILMAFNMFVASSVLLTKGGTASPSYPIEIGIVFVALIFLGAGRYSLDKE